MIKSIIGICRGIERRKFLDIKGNKLTPGIYKNLSDGEKDMLAQNIALFLRELHSIALPDIEGLESDIMDDYRGDYDALRETIYDKIPDKSKVTLLLVLLLEKKRLKFSL